MPELPEVETVKKILEKRYVNKTITKIEILYQKMIHSPIDEFIKNITGAKIISVTRKGKYLFINFNNKYSIISHLRMEGKYILRQNNEDVSSHTRVVFYLDDDTKLCYDDSRCFGVMYLSKTENIFENKEVKKLGPEPFDILDPNYLYQKFHKSNSEIKLCLLDQSIMAGLGNIYCDEVLFNTKINPFRKAKTLSLQDCQNILTSSVNILNKAISLGGSTVSSYHPEKGIDGKFQNQLNVYGKVNQACPICQTSLLKDKLGGRGTTYCPNCQKVGISIGLTGKIASGKSTVLELFKNKGIDVFSSDVAVDNLYKDLNFKKEIIKLFTEKVLNDDLTISKGYIKNQISIEPSLKKQLESLIHPIIKKQIENFIFKHKETRMCIIEVPLLFEAKFDHLFDFIIGVNCSNITQLKNLKNRGSKNINLDLMINSSSNFDKNAHKCDFLIDNDGTIDELKHQVDEIYNQLLSKVNW